MKPRKSAPKRRNVGRWLRQSPALMIFAAVLSVVAILVALFTTLMVSNPDLAQNMLAFGPSPTLFVLNPSVTLDPRGTLPPTWTPSVTAPPPDTATPSSTPTITPTPTATTTPVPTLTFTPPATVPVGWYEFFARDAKIAMQMPGTWTALTLLGRDPATALAEITQNDPVLLASIRDGLGQTVLDDMILIAFDTATSADPYIVNLSMAYANSVEGATIDEIRDAHLALYENSEFYEVIGSDTAQVDFRDANRIRYTTTFTDDAVKETTIYHLEVIAHQRRSSDPLLVATFSTSQERRNVYEALLDRIVGTIRFTR